jgi:hypothetical protein
VLIRLGIVKDIIELIIWIISHPPSIFIFIMADSQSHSLQDSDPQNQQPEDIIRQDYRVRVSSQQKYIVPNAFRDVDLPLLNMHKPDFSKAVNMAVGVSVFSQGWVFISLCLYPDSQLRSQPSLRILISLGKP